MSEDNYREPLDPDDLECYAIETERFIIEMQNTIETTINGSIDDEF